MLFRVEDRAPFLTYSEDHWRLGLNPLAQYSENSFTITQTRDATISFSFYGTAVEFYGSKKPDQGVFRVSIDGRPSEPQNATVAEEVYNVSLFATGNLPKGEHTVVLQNTGGRWRDMDYVTWDQSVGDGDEEVQVYTLQDSDPAFTYEPAGSWGTNPTFVEAYSGGNGHSTNVIGATARLKFQGDAIALYGPSGVNAAQRYSVRVDNRTEQSFSAAKFEIMPFRAKQLMYFGGNLGPGEHEMVVTLNSLNSIQQTLAIDYVEIFTTESIGGASCSASGRDSSSRGSGLSSSSSPPTGLIVAVAITGALAVICLGLLIWIFILVKKGKLTRPTKSPPPISPHTTQFGQSFASTPFAANHTGNSLAHHENTGHDSLYHRPDWGQSPTTTSPLNAPQQGGFSDTATFTSASSAAQLPYTQQASGAIRKQRNEIPRTEALPAPPPIYSDS